MEYKTIVEIADLEYCTYYDGEPGVLEGSQCENLSLEVLEIGEESEQQK